MGIFNSKPKQPVVTFDTILTKELLKTTLSSIRCKLLQYEVSEKDTIFILESMIEICETMPNNSHNFFNVDLNLIKKDHKITVEPSEY